MYAGTLVMLCAGLPDGRAGASERVLVASLESASARFASLPQAAIDALDAAARAAAHGGAAATDAAPLCLFSSAPGCLSAVSSSDVSCCTAF
jgi:hypothetical protein